MLQQLQMGGFELKLGQKCAHFLPPTAVSHYCEMTNVHISSQHVILKGNALHLRQAVTFRLQAIN